MNNFNPNPDKNIEAPETRIEKMNRAQISVANQFKKAWQENGL